MKEFKSGSTFLEIMIENSYSFWKCSFDTIYCLTSSLGSGVQRICLELKKHLGCSGLSGVQSEANRMQRDYEITSDAWIHRSCCRRLRARIHRSRCRRLRARIHRARCRRLRARIHRARCRRRTPVGLGKESRNDQVPKRWLSADSVPWLMIL